MLPIRLISFSTISVGEGSALILLTDTCSPLLRSEGISALLKRFFDLELFVTQVLRQILRCPSFSGRADPLDPPQSGGDWDREDLVASKSWHRFHRLPWKEEILLWQKAENRSGSLQIEQRKGLPKFQRARVINSTVILMINLKKSPRMRKMSWLLQYL